MKKETLAIVVRGVGGLVAMVLIWQLVKSAMAAGINGMVFFGGLAAIAGLGGYEIRWLLDKLRSRTPSDSPKE